MTGARDLTLAPVEGTSPGRRKDVIDESEFLRLQSVHPLIVIGGNLHFPERLPRVGSEEPLQPELELLTVKSIDHLIGLNDRLLTTSTASGLVDHDVGVRSRIAVPGHPAGKEECPHAGSDTDAHGLDAALGAAHAVVESETVVDAATRRADVQRDRLFLGLVAQEEDLRDQCTAALFGDRTVEVDDPLPQECGIGVHDPFATALCDLDDAGDDGALARSVTGRLEILHLGLSAKEH